MEDRELRELYVLKNPFDISELPDIQISSSATYSNIPGLPIRGKVYTIPTNEIRSDYCINSIADDTVNKNLSGNVATILKIQNNQTEILTYIVEILFREIGNPMKERLRRIQQEVLNLQVNYPQDSQPLETAVSLEVGTLRLELEEIKKEISKTNEQLAKLLERI